MKPILNNVLVRINRKSQSVGTVVGISNAIQDSCGFVVGDTIFTTEFGGVKFEHDGELYLWLTVNEVLGCCEPSLVVKGSSFMESLEQEYESKIRRMFDPELASI